jgi:hypothetical protein
MKAEDKPAEPAEKVFQMYKIVVRYYRIPELVFAVTSPRKRKGKTSPVDVLPYTKNDPGFSPSCRGGITLVSVLDGDGKTVAEASANCSLKDNFSYRIGREIAFGRLMKATHNFQTLFPI